MTSYFIRHTAVLAVSQAVISALYRENKVAVHFYDLRSENPPDYEKYHNQMGWFVDLAKKGGYVWGQYYSESNAKVGIVEAGTPIVFRDEKWGNPRYQKEIGKPAVLKTLQLTSVQIISPDRLSVLRACQPRQRTISPWPSAKGILAAVVDHKALDLAWENLSPSQQEIAFSEFLRNHDVPSLPTLDILLMPPGRTLKDIDLYGVATDGRELFAQVTFKPLSQAKDKLARLRQYSGSGNHLIFLCRSDTIAHQDGDVWVIPTIILTPWLQKRKQVLMHFLDEINRKESSDQASEAIGTEAVPQGYSSAE